MIMYKRGTFYTTHVLLASWSSNVNDNNKIVNKMHLFGDFIIFEKGSVDCVRTSMVDSLFSIVGEIQ